MILLATRSTGKLRELRHLFARAGIEVVDPTTAGLVERPGEEAAIEAFDTFAENAMAKARYFASRSGLPAVADDSGLEVAAIGGQPGVRSKRFSGRADLRGQPLDDANNALLLAKLAGTTDRSARYVCAAAFVGEGREVVRMGETAGRIVDVPRGSGGFGYDPYFESAELGRTFAELAVDEKEAMSHRGRAFRALLEVIAAVDRGPVRR